MSNNLAGKILFYLTSVESPVQSIEVADGIQDKNIRKVCQGLLRLRGSHLVRRIPKKERNDGRERPILYGITKAGIEKLNYWTSMVEVQDESQIRRKHGSRSEEIGSKEG